MIAPDTLLALLEEAAAIEHSLSLQYLYAAYSLRPAYRSIAGAPRPGHETLIGVALEEMHHLRAVNDVLVDLGRAPYFGSPAFPRRPDGSPISFELEPLSKRSLAAYVYLEAPPSAFSGSGRDLGGVVAAALALPEDPPNIGSLYRAILEELGALNPEDFPLRDVWAHSLQRVLEEGEGGHYEFFTSLLLGTREPLYPGIWDAPGHADYPARAIAANPRAEPPDATLEGEALRLGKLANRLYWAVLVLLGVSYRGPGADGLRGRAVDLMTRGLFPLAEALGDEGAGLPFDELPAPAAVELEDAARFLDEALTWASELRDERLGFALREVATECRDAARALIDGRGPRDLPPETKVVVGAGPAGLAAALTLARAGASVVLVERASELGGKAWSVRTELLDSAREHGVHGWWPGYRNFDRLLTEAGVDLEAALRPAAGAAVVGPGGVVVPIERSSLPLPSPTHLLVYFLRLPFATLGDLTSALGFSVHALAFDHRRDYAAYDEESFTDLLARLGVSRTLRDYVLGPFAVGFDYARPHEVSASSVLSAMQFYFLPSRDRIVPRWPRGLPQDVIFDPLVRAFEDAGGAVLRTAELDRLSIEGGRVTGVWLTDAARAEARGAREPLLTIERGAIPAEGLLERDSSAGPLLLARDGASVCAFSGRCPHRGDRVRWDAARGEAVCEGHGSVFARDGGLCRGPATAGLRALDVEIEGEEVRVLGAPATRLQPCDGVVMALDVRRTKAVLARSAGVPARLSAQLEELRATSVVVVRMWFPMDTARPPHETIVVPMGALVDVYFDVTRIDASVAHEGCVIEVHSTDERRAWSSQSDAAIVAAALADLAVLSDGFTAEAMLGARVQRHVGVFTAYEPGRDRHRPGADSGVAGLSLAGDWTRADWSVWMMERAVVSGLRAAAHLLEPGERTAALPPPKDDLTLRLVRPLARGLRRLLYGAQQTKS